MSVMPGIRFRAFAKKMLRFHALGLKHLSTARHEMKLFHKELPLILRPRSKTFTA